MPGPDPLDPQPGVCLIRWDTWDGATASLFVARPGHLECFAGRAPNGTMAVEPVVPNGAYYARLYDGDERNRLLGELRFGFTMVLSE